MKGNTKLFCWAMAISFAGSLPPGTLNLSVANYMLRHDLLAAIEFSVAAIAVEILLVRISLSAVKKLEGLKHYYKLFNLLTFVVLLLLAIHTLTAAYKAHHFSVALPFLNLCPIAAGLLLSTINPLHLPFWIGWATVLKSRKILDEKSSSYNCFITAIGTGTALAFIVYGTMVHYLVDLPGQQQEWLSVLVGITLLVMALLQLYKMIPKWIITRFISAAGKKISGF